MTQCTFNKRLERTKPEGAVDCPYLPNKYWITPDGQIWHKYYHCTQKGPNPFSRYKNGYLEYSLYGFNGEKKNVLAHRAFALAYIPNPENKPEVDFLDGSKTNISLDNLKWSDRFDNKSHEYHTLKTMRTSHLWEKEVQAIQKVRVREANREKAREIDQYDVDGNYIKTWETASDIGVYLNCSQQNILPECKREFPRLKKGYYWRYKDEPLDITKCQGKVKKKSPSLLKNDKTELVYKTYLDTNLDALLAAERLSMQIDTVYYHLRKLGNAVKVPALLAK